MPILEDAKQFAEKLTGIARPASADLPALVRARKAHAFHFIDDGVVPNNPRWPLILYRGAVRLPAKFDPAGVFEALFESNGWGGAWRDGIYAYVHYHSRIHEVLGIARGQAQVQFGGNNGRTLALKPGDVAILPAGTGHRRLSASPDLLVVGAYPATGSYDLCTSSEDHDRAPASISKVGKPGKDPVYGKDGPLAAEWSGA